MTTQNGIPEEELGTKDLFYYFSGSILIAAVLIMAFLSVAYPAIKEVTGVDEVEYSATLYEDGYAVTVANDKPGTYQVHGNGKLEHIIARSCTPFALGGFLSEEHPISKTIQDRYGCEDSSYHVVGIEDTSQFEVSDSPDSEIGIVILSTKGDEWHALVKMPKEKGLLFYGLVLLVVLATFGLWVMISSLWATWLMQGEE